MEADDSRSAPYLIASTLALTFLFLSTHAAQLGGLSWPRLGTASVACVLLVSAFPVLSVRASKTPLRPLRGTILALVLAVSGSWLLDRVAAEALMASPLRGTVSFPLQGSERETRVITVDTLELPERRLLARITGRRRDFVLDASGFLRVPQDGSYLFDASCDDRCSLQIGDVEVFDVRGSASHQRTLSRGIHRFRLRYWQGAGPASLVVGWNGPALFELAPLDAYLSGEESRLGELRHQPSPAWALLLLWITWSVGTAWLLVRVGESRRAWVDALRTWYAGPPEEGPIALVRPLAWVAGGAAFVLLGMVAVEITPDRLAALREQYSVNPVRGPFVLERARNLPSFLLSMAPLCLLVAGAFAFLRRPTTPTRPSRPRSTTLLLGIGIAGALVSGAIISEHEWVRYGRPCYDSYCDYIELVRDVMVSPEPATWRNLHRFLLSDYHSNSPAGPIIIAGVSLVVPDLILSYRLVSLASTIAMAVLLIFIARRYLRLSSETALVGAFLFTATGAVQRSLLFPQTDALAMLIFMIAVERLLALRDGWTTSRYLTAVAALTLALFTKLSNLPLAGMAAVVLVWPTDRASAHVGLRMLLARAHLVAGVVGPPLIALGLFISLLGTDAAYRTEMVRITTLDSRASFHMIAFAVTLLPFVLAVVSTLRRPWTRSEALCMALVCVYLAGLWGSGASGLERYYLNALPLALIVTVGRFAPLPEMKRFQNVLVLCVAYQAAHTMRMAFHLYS